MSGQGMPQARPEHMREHMREHMTERHAARLTELKTKLKLDAGQEAAWKTFADAMQPPAAPMARPERAAMEKLTTPERIDQMQALHVQRDADMKKRGDATKAFYASLNGEQKKTFDIETARHLPGGRGMHRH
ncbi:MAG: Spy/CpxP family protein refolding chaperone [Limnohabitans sp.]